MGLGGDEAGPSRRARGGVWGLVSCCIDGDVVDISEGDGSGFGEPERREGGEMAS